MFVEGVNVMTCQFCGEWFVARDRTTCRSCETRTKEVARLHACEKALREIAQLSRGSTVSADMAIDLAKTTLE